MGARERVRAVVEHRRTQQFFFYVIVVVTAALALRKPAADSDFLLVLIRIGIGIFVVEILLRFWAYGWRYFRDPWAGLDIVAVAAAFVPGGLALLALRFLRIFRVLRLVSMFPSLRRIVAGLLAAIPYLIGIGFAIPLIIFVAGVIATNLFGGIAPQYFDDLGTSLMTLFQAMTGEGWPDVAKAVMDRAPVAWIFFVIYIVVFTLGALNILIAVMVNAMEQVAFHEAEERTDLFEERLVAEIRALREEVAALRDERGS
ncbi:voltage-gated sodium channel [Herbihabitans rhizosphaerae]|uniref:Voltage-gated sodium channel n=1 Tax=Herbihabitans rhizosphaerae TaxID=1872711 RepID=A0A4Q7KRS0_9PSEU|nr:ion transporter [Herbihabitans rhizosphaerae]RZS39106.1 voltage-gated sodium channel [Herbihabitans rhizosphaerae]